MRLGPDQPSGSPPGPSRRRRLAPIVTLGVVVLLAIGALGTNVVRGASDASDGSDTSGRPGTSSGSADDGPDSGEVRNAIVFLVDDMPDFSCAETRLYLPRSSGWLRERGTCYEHATTSTPVCCPARAQLQTGQYAHNNLVVSQESAHNLAVRDTVQRQLTAAGVDTYGIGKNLNGVNPREYYGVGALPTGFSDFDFWQSYLGAPGRFKLYDDEGEKYDPGLGLTSTETNGALLDAYLDDRLDDGERFFAYDAFFAPHKQGARYRPQHLPPSSPTHGDDPVPPFRYRPEEFARDKLPIFWGPGPGRDYYRRLSAARARALYDVDDQMAAAFGRLEDAGVLDETAVLFVSDNGYTDRGEDNWDGKSIPYPAAMDVPMLAWYPGRDAAVDRRDVALVDVAPTLYDLMGVEPDHLLDGHSLLGDHERDVVYGEYYAESGGLVQQESGAATARLRSWRMVRRGPESYVEWYAAGGATVFREYYTDPGMTRNLLFHTRDPDAPTPSRLRELRELLQRSSTCRGTVEQGSPQACP